VRLGLQQVQERQQVLALEQVLVRQQLEQVQRLSRLALQQLSVRLGSSS
jgi:hypothetical protein